MSTITATPAAPAEYHKPGDDGLFSEFERILVPMSLGTNCAFYLARAAEGYFHGFEFFIKSPKNHLKKLPALADGPADGLDRKKRLLLWLIDAHAVKFFSDHKSASKKLAEFRAAVAADKELPETLEPCDEGFDPLPGDVVIEKREGHIEISHELLAAASGDHNGADEDRCGGIEQIAPLEGSSAAPIERPQHADVPVDEIEVSPANKDRERPPGAVEEIAESIKARGLLQPIGLRDMKEFMAGFTIAGGGKRYRIIFGEGRWLAYKQLGLPTIEARIWRKISDADAQANALVENLQRHDINALDEANGFAELGRLGWTQLMMAKETGKDERTIRRALALLELPEKVRGMVRRHELSARQGRELSRWKDRPAVCEMIANAAVWYHISSDKLAEEIIPLEAIESLTQSRLLFRIEREDWHHELTADVAFVQVGQAFFCWDEAKYKANKKAGAAARKQADAAQAQKAAGKIERASTGKASVPVDDLKKSGVEFIALTGKLEIYADYLPAEIISTAIDKGSKAEIVVCLKPAELQKFVSAYRKVIDDDRATKIVAATERATARIRKLRRVGPRELAHLIAACLDRSNWTGGLPSHLSAASWKRQGFRAPKNETGGAHWEVREELLELGTFQALRVLLEETISGSVHDEERIRHLKWILETDELGFLEENDEQRLELLERLSAEQWLPAASEKNVAFEWSKQGVCQNPEEINVKMPRRSECLLTLARGPNKKWYFGYDLMFRDGGHGRNPWLNEEGFADRESAYRAAVAYGEAWFIKIGGKKDGKKSADVLADLGRDLMRGFTGPDPVKKPAKKSRK